MDRKQERAFEEFIAGSGAAAAKTTVIDTVTGGGVIYQDTAAPGSNGTSQPPAVTDLSAGSSPTAKQLDAMPASPAALRSVLLAQASQGITADPYGRQTDDDMVFNAAANLLWEPELSPGLRAALYKTGATLESAWSYPSGEFEEDLYLSVTYANHIPADPYQR